MRYEVFGPFTIPRKNGLVDRSGVQDFWDNVVGSAAEGLADACGCYIFSVGAAKGIIPWYIGLTEKNTFRKECFSPYQTVNYNEVLAAKRKARPLLYLVAKRTPRGRFVKPSKNGQADIQFLETYLIGHGLNRNQKLLNQKKTKFLKAMQVPGILNSTKGHPGKSAKSLQRVLGL